jgi:archaellum biogenesis ATPase FlaH
MFSVPRLEVKEPPKMLVGDWLPLGTVGLITAAPNVGKTAMSIVLSESLELGTKFFNQEVINKAKAIFIQFDMSDWIFSDYNNRYAPNINIGVIEGNKYTTVNEKTIVHQRINLSNQDDCAELMTFCKEIGAEVIIIDSLSTAFPNFDENTNNLMTQALTELKAIATQGFAVIVLHHTSKSSNKYNHVARGAGSILACVDYHLEMSLNGKTKSSSGMVEVFDVKLTKTRHTVRKRLFSAYVTGDGVHECVPPKSVTMEIFENIKKLGGVDVKHGDAIKGIGHAAQAKTDAFKKLVELGVLKVADGPRQSKLYTIISEYSETKEGEENEHYTTEGSYDTEE